MHPKLLHALEQIDAAVFNGDTFDDPGDLEELTDYINRWVRHLEIPIKKTRNS